MESLSTAIFRSHGCSESPTPHSLRLFGEKLSLERKRDVEEEGFILVPCRKWLHMRMGAKKK